jgi:DNA-binding winged helix-turn-helix (wHTH) protein/tetratricopeptide (TPR) repeat protein/TolB-like protein
MWKPEGVLPGLPQRKEEYEFPPFLLDVGEGVLLRDGQPVSITPKALDVLAVLIRHRPMVVAKESFVREVWGDVAVSEGNLQTQILTARRALGDFGDKYIQTVPKRGYKFAGTVLERAAETPKAPEETLRRGGGLKVVGGRRFAAIVSLAAAAIVALTYWLAGHASSTAALAERKSIAVLDFRNLRGDPAEGWIGTAVPALLRTEIEGGKRLRTISSENVDRMVVELPVREAPNLNPALLLRIRKDVGADLVLAGSYLVERPAGRLRLDITVLDTRTGAPVATLIETGSAAGVLDLVAHVGGAIRAKLSEPELETNEQRRLRSLHPGSLEALEFYSKGLAQMRNFNAKEARVIFEKALESDPHFALGHLALADAWSTLGYFENAKEEARRAYEASSDLPREQALWIEGRYRQLSHQWPRATEVYQSLWTFYPDNVDYGLALANAQVADLKSGDALKTILHIHKLGDEPRVDLAEANALESTSDFKGELTAARTAEKKALARGARLLAAAAQLKRVWALDNLGQFQEAYDAALQARRTYADYGDRGGEAAALKNMADVQGDWSKYADALQSYEKALYVFREIGHEERVALTLNNMAYVYNGTGDLATAQRLFQQSLDLGRAIQDKRIEAMALNGLAIILWRQGQIEQAKEKYQTAITTFQEAGDRSHAAVCLNNFAIALQDLGALQEAKRYYEQSLSEYRGIGDQASIAREIGNLGFLLSRLGDLKEAESDLQEQLTITRKLGDADLSSFALVGLARVFFIRDELQKARRCLEDSAAIFGKLGEKGRAAESEADLAEILSEIGEFAEGDKKARDAIAEFQREREVDSEAATRSVVSSMLLRSGKLNEAAQAAEAGISLGGNSQDREVRLNTRIAAGRVHAAEGHWEQAKKELGAAVADARKMGDFILMFNAQLALAELRLRKGEVGATSSVNELEQQARAKGFLLVARKANSLARTFRANARPSK